MIELICSRYATSSYFIEVLPLAVYVFMTSSKFSNLRDVQVTLGLIDPPPRMTIPSHTGSLLSLLDYPIVVIRVYDFALSTNVRKVTTFCYELVLPIECRSALIATHIHANIAIEWEVFDTNFDYIAVR